MAIVLGPGQQAAVDGLRVHALQLVLVIPAVETNTEGPDIVPLGQSHGIVAYVTLLRSPGIGWWPVEVAGWAPV